jgi:uncharacterized protein YndB with AHSA1/START domain
MTQNIVIERVYKASVQDLWELWTTKDGFQSWWGPQGFRVDIHEIDARLNGALHSDMIADSPEMIAAMTVDGELKFTPCKGKFSSFTPYKHLALTQMIDFLPGVEPYNSIISVDFVEGVIGSVQMVVTLSPMHDEAASQMQMHGFTSQLSKLDERFALAI